MVVPYSMFHVGCGGVIIHDNSILLIEEKRVSFSLSRASSKAGSEFQGEERILEKASSSALRDKSLSRLASSPSSLMSFGFASSLPMSMDHTTTISPA